MAGDFFSVGVCEGEALSSFAGDQLLSFTATAVWRGIHPRSGEFQKGEDGRGLAASASGLS